MSCDLQTPLLKTSSASDTYVLSALLPYEPSVKKGERFKDSLQEYLLLLTACEQVLEALKRGDFKSFDPLVGENACQIRAVKLAVIFSDTFEICDRLVQSLTQAKTTVQTYLSTDNRKIPADLSLQDVLKNIEITLDYRFAFLLKSFLLTKVKIVRDPKEDKPLVKNDYTDTKKVKEILKVGSAFAHNLIMHLRGKLSERSVKFVQKIAQEEMLSQSYIFDHRGLQCLPCFWATKALLKHALTNNVPIVLLAEQKAADQEHRVVNRTAITYMATKEGYLAVDPTTLDQERPALYLYGSSCSNFSDLLEVNVWEQKLRDHCPMEMILAYAASHRQYPDSSQDAIFEEKADPSYSHYKRIAQEWGCSLENPALFFLAHAYCDKIANIGLHFK